MVVTDGEQEGDKISKSFYVTYGKNVMSAQMLEVPLLGVGRGSVSKEMRDQCSSD